jgi:hypothetical protein
LILFVVASFVGFGCGGDDENPPEIDAPTVTCGAPPDDSYAETDVVTEISVRVQDPDRDLPSEGVSASANGLMLGELSDDDGDQRFNWTPPVGSGPIICRGTLSVRVVAEDVRGNAAERTEKIDLDQL